MTEYEKIFDKENSFAIVGISRDLNKYGRIVYEKLKKQGYKVYGINPNIDFIDGQKIYSNLSELDSIDVVIFVVPPMIVKTYLDECVRLKIKIIWLQPGSEDKEIIDFCNKKEIICVHNQCIMLNS
jgi:predicted CoA-binding protein